jgi:hypothetical protein
MIYSDHVLEAGNHYVLYTPEMSPDSLAAHGLLWNDSYATDHILVCADYRPASQTGIDHADGSAIDKANRLRLDPNPAWEHTRIGFDLPRSGTVLLEVYDERGRRVAAPLGSSGVSVPAGAFSCLWDGSGIDGRKLAAGVYFVRVRGRGALGDFRSSGKWILLR